MFKKQIFEMSIYEEQTATYAGVLLIETSSINMASRASTSSITLESKNTNDNYHGLRRPCNPALYQKPKTNELEMTMTLD